MPDIKSVLSDTEEILKQAANAKGEQANELRAKALSQLKLATDKAAAAQGSLIEKGKQVTCVTDNYVHQHPWQSIGIAVGIGILAGLLLNRK